MGPLATATTPQPMNWQLSASLQQLQGLKKENSQHSGEELSTPFSEATSVTHNQQMVVMEP
jgi:hypothetical protein